MKIKIIKMTDATAEIELDDLWKNNCLIDNVIYNATVKKE